MRWTNDMNGDMDLPSPLGPYRVLDLSSGHAAICARLLADLGADVVKIEPPGGDPSRMDRPFHEGIDGPERSLDWWAFNSNKRSVTLDIENDEGRELLLRLIDGADFLVETFPPGHLDRLGMGFQALQERRPGLIAVSITPFGQSGPYSGYQGPDIVMQAMGGFMHVTGEEDGPPMRIGYPNAFLHAGVEGAVGALIASYHRLSTGEGQHVDVSAQQCVVWTLMDVTATWDLTQENLRRSGNTNTWDKSGRSFRHHFPCKDGYVSYSSGAGVRDAKNPAPFYKMVEEDGYDAQSIASKRWMSADVARSDLTTEEVEEGEAFTASFLAGHTRQELYDVALAARFLFAPVLAPREVTRNYQMRARESVLEVEQTGDGKLMPFPGPLAKLSRSPGRISRRAPRIGEHNDEIYLEELGLSKQEADRLKAAGAI